MPQLRRFTDITNDLGTKICAPMTWGPKYAYIYGQTHKLLAFSLANRKYATKMLHITGNCKVYVLEGLLKRFASVTQTVTGLDSNIEAD